jgi:hypothetical protein
VIIIGKRSMMIFSPDINKDHEEILSRNDNHEEILIDKWAMRMFSPEIN